MGHLSAQLHRVCVPWQGLLLTASLLTFWNPPTSAQLTIESVPSNAAEGKEVLLLARNLPQDTTGFNWHKGGSVDSTRQITGYVIATQLTTRGPAYSGRETVYPNASLLIQNVTLNDTGFYTLQVITANLVNTEATGQFRVYQLNQVAQPEVQATSTTVTENKDSVNLTCSTNDTEISIKWFFNSQNILSSERIKLFQDNRTLRIDPVKREDAGQYYCEVSNPISVNQSDPIMLIVKYTESSGLSGGAIAGIVIGVLAGMALIAALVVYFLHSRKTGRASDQRDLTEHKLSDSNHTQDHSDNSPNKMNEVTYSSLNFTGQQPRQPTSASSSPTTTDVIYSEVKMK
uniref:Ig-like domain-containing protein n=1 Tax=Saimiri boliviensis boliviensis TaxID=39432 RepID=A0A2K6SNT1_SAIBB